MSKRFSLTICLVVSVAFILAGCKQEIEEEVNVSVPEPQTERITAPSDSASRAIEAAGGLEAWTKTKKLQLDCVVTFYQPDGSFYLTEQSYEVYPLLNSIEISAGEPQGRLSWKWSNGQFTVLHGDPAKIDDLLQAVGKRCFSQVILNIITAPARFLDNSVEFTKQTDAVKIQGQWYYRINRRSMPGIGVTPSLSEEIFYQDRDNSLVDMIQHACSNKSRLLAVRGYDYKEVEKGGLLVPARIEIFSADARGDLQKRLVKIDCHGLRYTK